MGELKYLLETYRLTVKWKNQTHSSMPLEAMTRVRQLKVVQNQVEARLEVEDVIRC